MTDIMLMAQINNQMRAEGIANNPMELARRYNLARHGQPTQPPPTPAELLTDVFGGSVPLWEKVVKVMERATDLTNKIRDSERTIEILEQGDRCNGWTHINRAGSMYIHHAAGVVCPMHGRYIKDRGRVYIGRKTEKQIKAIQALAINNSYEIEIETYTHYTHQLNEIDDVLTRLVTNKT